MTYGFFVAMPCKLLGRSLRKLKIIKRAQKLKNKAFKKFRKYNVLKSASNKREVYRPSTATLKGVALR